MEDDEPISLWIDRLKDGDQEAASKIWDQFFDRVRRLAEKKLGSLPRRVADEDDLALSALNALCDGAVRGKFSKLENRDDLWQILAMITSRKAALSWRKSSRRAEVGESILEGGPSIEKGLGMAQIAGGQIQPQFLDSLSATCGDLLGQLDERLREVALLRLQGYTNEEIAERQNRSVKSIERYLKTIRDVWTSGHDQIA